MQRKYCLRITETIDGNQNKISGGSRGKSKGAKIIESQEILSIVRKVTWQTFVIDFCSLLFKLTIRTPPKKLNERIGMKCFEYTHARRPEHF